MLEDNRLLSFHFFVAPTRANHRLVIRVHFCTLFNLLADQLGIFIMLLRDVMLDELPSIELGGGNMDVMANKFIEDLRPTNNSDWSKRR